MPELTPTKIDRPQPELEELSESVDLPAALPPIAVGTSLETPAGPLHIESFLGCKGTVNLYDAMLSDNRKVSLRETQDACSAKVMCHEFEVLEAPVCPMFLQSLGCWEKEGRTYLVNDPVAGKTLADLLGSKELTTAQLLSTLTQVAYALSLLHLKGWVHLGLRPGVVVLGKPIRLLDLAHSTRIGQKPPTPFYFAGYSAPELLADKEIDARADIYSVGALLFHAVAGYPIAETGPTLTGWQSEIPLAGVPQLLEKCLGAIESRYTTMAELHQDLIRLTRRCVPRIRYECVSATTIGLEPTRTVNQDAYGFSCLQSESEDGPRAWAVATVADGMGGMAAGELASDVAVNTVLTECLAALTVSSRLSIEEQSQVTADWVRKANEKVCDAMETKQARGGCTLVCALLIDTRLTIAWVGDSRIYLIRGDTIQMLTRDHSVAMSLVLQGELDINELRSYPDRSTVTRSLGERLTLPGHYVDTLAQITGKESLELQFGDTLVLCSDGLWEPIVEQNLIDILAQTAPDLRAAADNLIALVLQKGATDNATVSLLRINEVPPQTTEGVTVLNIVFHPHRNSLMAGTADSQKLFAMLKVLPDSETASARAPLAFALVIDTSGSMREYADQEKAAQEIKLRNLQGQQDTSDGVNHQAFNLQQTTKLDQAIEAAHKLVDHSSLLPTDKVTIIYFDTEAAPLVPLTPIAQRTLLHQAIDSLRDHSGQTFMAKGMACAQQQLSDLPKETAKRVVLLTDGATQAEAQCRRLAGEFAEANTPVIAIGIGPEYKEKLMLELAQVSQGRPYHLENMGQLAGILDGEVGSSVREVVTDLEAKVAHVKGVTVNSCTRVYPSLSEVSLESQPFRLGNVAAGDYTVFIVEFTVEGLARPVSRVRLAQVSLAGSVPAQHKREEFSSQDLFVTFTNDEAAVAAVDPEVLGYVQQKNVDNLIQKAMGQATVDAGQARKTLQVAAGMTQRIGNAAMTKVLNNALEELNKTGNISAGTRKTVALGGRTKTVKTGSAVPLEGVPSEEEIRKLSGT